jgi:hypothetical protein
MKINSTKILSVLMRVALFFGAITSIYNFSFNQYLASPMETLAPIELDQEFIKSDMELLIKKTETDQIIIETLHATVKYQHQEALFYNKLFSVLFLILIVLHYIQKRKTVVKSTT